MSSENKAPFLGILMLDTRFPRIRGDAGCPETYPFAVNIEIVENADSTIVVDDKPLDFDLLNKFCIAARKLESAGAKAIISTCGFLVTDQDKIADAVNIPVTLSALSIYPQIKDKVGDKKIGILTASSKSLGPKMLNATGIMQSDVMIKGMEECDEFRNAILTKKINQSVQFDPKIIENFAAKQITEMIESEPNMGAVLLECGNLPPYCDAIKKATGLPVYSILDVANQMMKNHD